MKERNCNMPYPMYGQMPMVPMMPVPNQYGQQACSCQKNDNVNERLDNLERRVNNLERMMNNNINNNYQMM